MGSENGDLNLAEEFIFDEYVNRTGKYQSCRHESHLMPRKFLNATPGDLAEIKNQISTKGNFEEIHEMINSNLNPEIMFMASFEVGPGRVLDSVFQSKGAPVSPIKQPDP